MHIIVALFITGIIIGAIYLVAGKQIEENISLINMVAIEAGEAPEEREIKLETSANNKKELDVYPSYGSQYATIQIPKIDVDLPVYLGDTIEILKKGVGHYSASYFPGEGGSIVYMGHNSAKVFRRFSELQIGNEIFVKTSYGDFKYKIYDMQIIDESEGDEKIPIQHDEEKLMVYTCYPFINIGYTSKRFVVYANLEQ